jgi:hypothetical protein
MVLVNLETETNMTTSIEANTKLNMDMNVHMNVTKNANVKVILQMGMKHCRFAGCTRSQIKTAGVGKGCQFVQLQWTVAGLCCGPNRSRAERCG